MKYVLLIYLEENALSDTEREQCYADSAQLAQQLDSGKSLVTDGPFAETREQLGGFFLIDAQNLDDAIAIATQIPAAKVGTVEIRPVIEVAGLPAQS